PECGCRPGRRPPPPACGFACRRCPVARSCGLRLTGAAQRGGDQRLGLGLLELVEKLLGLGRRVAEVDEAVAGHRVRPGALLGGDHPASFSCRAPAAFGTGLGPSAVPGAIRAPWQIATASASAAWSGAGASGRPSSIPTILWTCFLSAPPAPHTAILIACGV